LSEDPIENVLKSYGLTHLESEVYIFLAKHGILRCSEISRQMKKDRAQTLRILKSLQAKNIVEATLEVPTRYSSIPFERVIDLRIKAKRDEATLMESTKKELLDYWTRIGKASPELPLEKFVALEGDRKIYSKIVQMMEETKNQLSSVLTVTDLVRSSQYWFSQEMPSWSGPKTQFRFITEVTDQNAGTLKSLLKKTVFSKVKIMAWNPDLGLGLFPRMMIRDNEEILLFMERGGAESEGHSNLCLWTNCKTIVQSFIAVFEDLWINSTGVHERIEEIQSGRPIQAVNLFTDIIPTLKTYEEALASAKEEIMMLISSEGLLHISKRIALLRELSGKGVSLKIMTPVTSENWQTIQELSRYCSIKHAPASPRDSTVIDGKQLIQSKSQSSFEENRERIPYFGTSYSDDPDYVQKTRNLLTEMWRCTPVLSISTLESILNASPVHPQFSSGKERASKSESIPRKLGLNVKPNREVMLEKDVLNKLIKGERYPSKNWPHDAIRFYGSNGLAVIHPPENFNLPDMTIWAMHHNKQSSFGASDCLLVYLWLETPKGMAYVPVAAVSDNPAHIEFHKVVAAGTPSEHNAQLVRKDALQIRIQGNTLFVGWTDPIHLISPLRTLPPSCLLLEGYNPLTTGIVEFRYPSRIRVTSEFNGFDAFLTYFHPASKYSGPGTDGRINRDMITTFYPP